MGREAHDVLQATANELAAGLLVVAEPNKAITSSNSWMVDNRHNAAIKLLNKNIPTNRIGRGNGSKNLKVCVNTKSEIKRAGADLLQLCIRLNRLNKSRPKCPPSVRKADCATQADAPSVSTNSRIELRDETKDAGTQTIGADEEESESRRLALRREIELSSTLEGLQAIMDLDWPKSVYKRVNEVSGDVTAAPWDSDMVLFTTVDFQLSKGLARCFKERSVGAAELRAQDAKIGGVAYLINSIMQMETPLAEKSPLELDSIENLYKVAGRLKELLQKHGRHKVAVPCIPTYNWDQVGNTFEYVFKDTEVKGAHAVRRKKQTVLHLKGLDRETNKDEIEDALREAVGDKADRCRVSLRPALGESQNATVLTDADAAQQILKIGSLPIGRVHCQITERERSIFRKGPAPTPEYLHPGWSLSRLNKSKFGAALQQIQRDRILTTDDLIEELTIVCNRAMPPRIRTNMKNPVCWWSQEIAELRRECLKTRRAYIKRNLQAQVREIRRLVYKVAKQTLRTAIRRSKSECWKQLIADIENDIWLKGHRIAFSAVHTSPRPPRLTLDRKLQIVQALFPEQQRITNTIQPNTTLLLFTVDELQSTVEKLKSRKAPGTDGIPAEIIKGAVQGAPEIIFKVMNEALRTGCFPVRWKCNNLTLIPKKDEPLYQPSGYRAICLIDTVGKLLEHMILARLEVVIAAKNGLSCKQFGFRKRKSTIVAVYHSTERIHH
nr:unnamed protein product [Callosobruchus analis]